MFKKSLILFMASVLCFGFAALARPQKTADRGLTYLGVLAKGYPDSLVRSQLALAKVEVHAIREGMIIFSVNANSKTTPFFNEHLPFLEGVYLDSTAVLQDAKAARTRIAREFITFFSRHKDLDGITSPSTEPERKSRYFLQGVEKISRNMLAIDKMIARIKLPIAGFYPKGATDDGYEENDTFATAAAITPGTYSDLQNLDDDWYKVTVGAGQDLVVTTQYNDDLGNLYLELYNSSENSIGYSVRVVSGLRRATAANLAAGDYYIRVYGSGDLAYKMTVETGDLLGRIAGIVTNSSSAPIEHVWVYGYSTNWYSLGSAETNGAGKYLLEVFPGQTYVWFDGVSAGNFLSEYYNNKTPDETPDQVTVAADATTSGINAQLADGGSISGRVTLETTGAGLYDIYVRAYDSNQNYYNNYYTDSDGYYTIPGLRSGIYKVYFSSYENYAPEWYNNKGSFISGDPLGVTAGSDTPGVNAQLAAGATISGRVRDPYGVGINNIPVEVYDGSGNYLYNDYTDSNGDYAITNLPAGGLKVLFKASYGGTYLDEWYNDKHSFYYADPVNVTAGSTTANINADVLEGGGIGGRVTDGSGNGISSVYVKVFDLDANEIMYYYTDSDGYYELQGLYPGSYKVWFDAYYASDFASEWYNDKGSFDTGNMLAVSSGSTTTNIDAVLGTGGTISGTVLNPGGGGLGGVVVAAYDLDHRLAFSTQTYTGGQYYLDALAPGCYKIYFDPTFTTGQYIAEWYFDKANFDLADPLTVTAGAQTNAAATILSQGTRISVTSPVAGNVWFTKSLQQITWTKIGVQNAAVKIQLYRGTALANTISLNTPNDGVFDWTLPLTLTANTNYRVKITTLDNKVTAYSSYFTIARPSITVTAPAAGAAWTRGAGYTITWTRTGTQNALVKIRLYKGSRLKLTLAASTDNDGSFAWTVPATLAVGTNYKVRINTIDGAVTTDSGWFTIN